MTFFNNPYYSIGQKLTRLIGQWPYQKLWEKRFFQILTIFLCTTQFIAEVLGVIVYFDDKEAVLESISPFMIDAAVACKYMNVTLNLKTMMKLLNQLKENWTMCTSEEEKLILNEYAYVGRFIVYGYVGLVYITTILFITEPLVPKWISLILQSNETIPNKYPVPIYWYIIDMNDNFYPILCYEAICIIVILTVTLASDAMFIVFLQHACALFVIVGKRLENLPSKQYLENNWKYSNEFRKTNDIQHDYFVMCIQNHKRAIEFAELLENMYVWCFGVVIALNMPIMSVTAVQIATQSNTILKLTKYSMYASGQVLHLFFDCFLSQQLTDFSTAVQKHLTYSNWYDMSAKTQKLVILVTLRTQEPCKLTAGQIVPLSMETFCTIIKTAISYFTVMVSMR